jgi:hypothetical protein
VDRNQDKKNTTMMALIAQVYRHGLGINSHPIAATLLRWVVQRGIRMISLKYLNRLLRKQLI